jgi:hypothetical protein
MGRCFRERAGVRAFRWKEKLDRHFRGKGNTSIDPNGPEDAGISENQIRRMDLPGGGECCGSAGAVALSKRANRPGAGVNSG